MKQRQRKIDKLMYAEIEERRKQPDASRTDILTLMMAAHDKNRQPMTDEELSHELMTLLFAGHETTATADLSGRNTHISASSQVGRTNGTSTVGYRILLAPCPSQISNFPFKIVGALQTLPQTKSG